MSRDIEAAATEQLKILGKEGSTAATEGGQRTAVRVLKARQCVEEDSQTLPQPAAQLRLAGQPRPKSTVIGRL